MPTGWILFYFCGARNETLRADVCFVSTLQLSHILGPRMNIE